MKTPQIMVDRLKAITTEHKAQHIANVIELANANKLKEDFDVKTHIANILLNEAEEKDLKDFDYKAITKPITRHLTEETRLKRFKEQMKKQAKKYGVDIDMLYNKKGE